MKKKWYCYVCGKKLTNIYYLISMKESTDRVFLVCNGKSCVKQVEAEDVIITKIKEKE